MTVMQTRDVMVVTIFFCMVTLIHIYLGWRLIALVPTTPGRTLLGLALALSVIIIFFCFSLRRTAPAVSFWLLIIEWSGYLLLGFILLLFAFLTFRDALTVLT